LPLYLSSQFSEMKNEPAGNIVNIVLFMNLNIKNLLLNWISKNTDKRAKNLD